MMCFNKDCQYKQEAGPQECPAANSGCDGYTHDAGKIVYIAGKITGDRGYKAKFDRARKALEGQGYIVINPADMPAGMTPAGYMRICFAMMDTADIVAFLPDHTDSRGANLEYDWCKYVGKQTMYLEYMTFYKEAVK